MSTLYVVATPIGNLEDITYRAVRILGEVAVIACEDTRMTKRLLERYEIMTPMISFHQHSDERKIRALIERLQEGDKIAVVTDAGTPGVSDPGNKLVAAAIAADIPVVPIPGPAAITALLSVAGVPTDSFRFLGFVPHKKGRQTLFRAIAAATEPVIFYESSHRIMKALQSLVEVLTDEHHVIVGRELTKVFEEIIRGSAAEVLAHVTAGQAKGEFVVLVTRFKNRGLK